MSAVTPELFTLTFWQTTTARIVHWSAVGALGAWGGGAAGAHTGVGVSIPSAAVGITAAAFGVYGLVLSLAGAAVPASPSRPLAALYPKPSQQLEVRLRRRTRRQRVPRRRPLPDPQTPTTADLLRRRRGDEQ